MDKQDAANTRNTHNTTIAMTKDSHDIQTTSTKRKGFQPDHVLLSSRLKNKIQKTPHSHFLKFIVGTPYCTLLVLLDTEVLPSQN